MIESDTKGKKPFPDQEEELLTTCLKIYVSLCLL